MTKRNGKEEKKEKQLCEKGGKEKEKENESIEAHSDRLTKYKRKRI